MRKRYPYDKKTREKPAGMEALTEPVIQKTKTAGADFTGTSIDTLLIGNAMQEIARIILYND
ncbi:hypothetical protein [Haliea sp.]